MAGYSVKARVSKDYRKKNGIMILIVGALSCVGLGLCVYSFITASYLFAIGYLCAIILGFTYVFIRYNAVFSTYAATDKHSLYMRNWTNGFFPYNTEMKLSLISEFVPSKTILYDMPVRDIETVAIGTKNFIKRNVPDCDDFIEEMNETESGISRSKAKKILGMDILYAQSEDGECIFMPIVNFSKRDVIKLVQLMQRKNPDITVKIGSRGYKSYMSKTKPERG